MSTVQSSGSVRALSVLAFIASAVPLAGACGHGAAATSTTTITAATVSAPLDNVQPIDAIAGTRCKREAKCANVGADRRYHSYDDCMTAIRSEGLHQATATTCPHGFDSARLDVCLASIRREGCQTYLDTIGRLATCSTDEICRP